MNYMFNGCIKFNQSLDKWDLSNVEFMNCIFNGCSSLNKKYSQKIIECFEKRKKEEDEAWCL